MPSVRAAVVIFIISKKNVIDVAFLFTVQYYPYYEVHMKFAQYNFFSLESLNKK